MPVADEMRNRVLANEDATVAFGLELYDAIRQHCGDSATVYLHGNLGAGKTTLVRGFLRMMNHVGAVKSPTYTLLEPYRTASGDVFHFDLYRLKSPEELEFLGFDEIFAGSGYKFVEWPEQGTGWLPPANVEVFLSLHKPARVGGEMQQMQREVSVRFA
jgi:tRNA threonylcarbamoyladenosine biosynthesis protein TsaE